MQTYISDTFPLKKLECQFLMVCKHYDPKSCGYSEPCPYNIILGTERTTVREILNSCLERYVMNECLTTQIKLIVEEK